MEFMEEFLSTDHGLIKTCLMPASVEVDQMLELEVVEFEHKKIYS